MTEKNNLSKIFNVVATIGFFADLITIGIFIRDLFIGGLNEDSLSHIVIIVIIFLFSYLLLTYSKSEQGRDINNLISLFGWIYVVFSAAILGIFSYYFLNGFNYSFGQYISYYVIVVFIVGLGLLIFGLLDKDFKYLSIPFLLVAVEQIVIWVIKLLTPGPISENVWVFIGGVLLFFLASLIAMGMIYYDRKIYTSSIPDW
jgi:hypothetical protein